MCTYICTHGTRAHTAQQQRTHVRSRPATSIPARCARAQALGRIKCISKRRCRTSQRSSPGTEVSARWPLRARAGATQSDSEKGEPHCQVGRRAPGGVAEVSGLIRDAGDEARHAGRVVSREVRTCSRGCCRRDMVRRTPPELKGRKPSCSAVGEHKRMV